jgi:hypothetical protein
MTLENSNAPQVRPILEVGRGRRGNFCVGGGWENNLNHLGVFDRFANIGCDFCQFAEAAYRAIFAIEFDAAALFDNLDMGSSSVEKCDGKSHQCQMRGHGLAAMPCADYGVFSCHVKLL